MRVEISLAHFEIHFSQSFYYFLLQRVVQVHTPHCG